MKVQFGDWLRYLRWQWLQRAKSVDHESVIKSVDSDGGLSASYLFMCVMSAGIAITGLLVNSPAVIIGAMLISPLMAPIVRLGLGVSTLDHKRAQRALGVLAAGMALSLITAMLIVWASPIRDLTPEIAARTHPNLFDLVIAVLSGLAGGYAMVRGRGGAIVGVAIATALMPPMAVVGYGLGSLQWAVAKGAMLLFTTNLVAIALSVTAITTWYGFSRRLVRHAMVWQTGLAFILVLPLIVPLWQSLSAIAREAQMVHAVRRAVSITLGADDSRVMALQVAIGRADAPSRVDLTLAARHYDIEDDNRLRAAIADAIGGPLKLRLSPILEADLQATQLADSSLANPVAALPPTPVPAALAIDPVEAMLANFPIPLASHELDHAARRMALHVGSATIDLTTCREIERELQGRFSDWTVRVVPPVQGLPEVPFARASASLDDDSGGTVDLVIWALHNWDVASARVYGFASTEGSGNEQLAHQRAAAVAQALEKAGISAEPVVAYRQPDQDRGELRSGRGAYRVAVVTPLQRIPNQPHRATKATTTDRVEPARPQQAVASWVPVYTGEPAARDCCLLPLRDCHCTQ